ncbi:MAG: hypothetical protein JW939_06635 [Candidatus Thermoplasmatota archaeon]|nr:hypothetical protein [Candidatus Thermoplasmatota archaeon]
MRIDNVHSSALYMTRTADGNNNIRNLHPYRIDMTGRDLKELEGGKCPMCGSKDITYWVHAQPPSRDIWHCNRCGYEWYHFY